MLYNTFGSKWCEFKRIVLSLKVVSEYFGTDVAVSVHSQKGRAVIDSGKSFER